MSMTIGEPMPASCDVAVIGAGLVGALVARQLAEADLHVVVLETQAQVGGSAEHSAALALLGTPEPFASLAGRLGDQAALDIWQLTQRNLESLASWAQRLGVDIKRKGSFRPVADGTMAERLQRSAALLTEAGFPVTVEDATDLGMLIGLRTEGDLSFDAKALLHALLDAPQITVQTETEVQKVLAGPEDVEIWAQKHFLKARAVVLAAGAYVTHLNRSLADYLTVMPLHAVDCEASDPLDAPLILENGQILVQQVWPAWQLSTCPESRDASPWTLLSKTAAQFCPEAKVLKRSNGWVAQSMDALPIVGGFPDMPHVYTVSGLGAWGFSWAFVAVERLMDVMFKDTDPGILSLKRFLA